MNCNVIRGGVMAVGVLWALTLGACATPSVHPIYSGDDAPVHEPGIVGQWKADEAKETYAVSADGDGYRMVVKNNDAKAPKQWEFSARLVKIGETNFVDFMAAANDRDEIDEKWGPLFAPTHLFAGWSLTKDTLTVRMLKADWLESALRDKRVSLAHTRLDGHTLLITAETVELQKFLKAYGGDEKAFADVVTLKRLP